MSWEGWWYASYADGQPPHCWRLARQPMRAQWHAAITLARGLADGRAGYRDTWLSLTREEYWYCTDSLGACAGDAAGWWIIPSRVARRARHLYREAIQCAVTRGRGQATDDEVAAVLRAWQQTGTWRRHVAGLSPRHHVATHHPLSRQPEGA